MKSYSNFIDINDSSWLENSINLLKKDGIVVIRGISNINNIKTINNKAKKILAVPALLGSNGYNQKDIYKKTYDGFLIGKEVVEIVTNENILDIIEKYLNDSVNITELQLKKDLGHNIVYFPYHMHNGSDLNININENKPFGCGTMLYLHDTDIGAFCYALGSHNISYKDATEENDGLLSSSNNRLEIENNLYRIHGKKGDIIIFDERGYHGPEQPVKAARTVLIYGYQSVKASKNTTRTEIPIIINHLKGLNIRQLNTIGFNSSSRGNYEDYHFKSFSKRKTYKYMVLSLQIITYLNLKINKLKYTIKNII
jgi:hypothetical protein